jgi:hypothetical protein
VNFQVALTPSQQRLVDLINIGRPLTDEESDELYRLLHSDYMRKWRAAKRKNDQIRRDLELSADAAAMTLDKLRAEAAQPEWHQERR